ncbi:hypothetical protein JVU11DRAFT_2049 [Chiua virens]|nr:hypothetical protein JVU11DRAFT_2049 [Chiua virens]
MTMLPRFSKPRGTSNCQSPDPANTLTDRLNTLLNSSGPGYVLSLCPSEQYVITAPLLFTAPNQEISTAGYPTDSTRATLVVAGTVFNGTGHSTAVDGTCGNCDSVKLRNVQINGTRLGAPPLTGGANIEMGGSNADQLIEYVHSFDPRSWSCLHIAEGNLTCTNVTIQNNDIGPAGSDLFQQWADGISVACTNSLIKNNMINNPTDGGIVLFGAPGTRVENNTIWVETNTLLGGINLVDVSPFGGNYSGVVDPRRREPIMRTSSLRSVSLLALAPGSEPITGTTSALMERCRNNQLTGAFSYGIGMTSAKNFTVENNVLIGNTSFIGARGPNCTGNDTTPSPAPFVIDYNTVSKSTTQLDFGSISDGDSLTCVLPPDGGDYWPFGGNPDSTSPAPAASPISTSKHPSTGATAGIVVGAIAAVVLVAVITWFVRRWAMKRTQAAKLEPRYLRDPSGYVQQKF